MIENSNDNDDEMVKTVFGWVYKKYSGPVFKDTEKWSRLMHEALNDWRFNYTEFPGWVRNK